MFEILSLLVIVIILNIILFSYNNFISTKINLFDLPDKERKFHDKPISLNGGIFFYLNILIIFLYDYFANHLYISSFFGFENEIDIFNFILILFFLLCLGVIDDKLSLKPFTKTTLSIILFATFLIANNNFEINELRFAELEKILDLFNLSFFFTLACFATLQIAFNMYDGINLQSSVYYSVLALFFLIFSNDYGLKLFCFLTIIYLIFFSINNYKNKIFLGDNGVFVFSFIFCLIITKEYNSSILLNVESILILLLFPFLDLIRLFLIRLKTNTNPFVGDRNHIQHILLNKFGIINANVFLILPLIISIILIFFLNINLLLVLLSKFAIYIYLIYQKKR